MWRTLINNQISILEEAYVENQKLGLVENCIEISKGVDELRQLIIEIEEEGD